MAYRVYNPDGISKTLAAVGGGTGAKTGLYAVKVGGLVDLSYKEFKQTEIARCLKARYTAAPTNHACEDSGVIYMSIKGQKLQKQIDVSQALDSSCRNNLLQKQTCCAVLTPDRAEKRQNGRRMKEPEEPSFTLTAQDRHGVALLSENIRIRRLTPRECWRLQGFPDEYFDKAKAAGISDTQLYKQAGNGVTVNVARAIGERLKEVEEHGC